MILIHSPDKRATVLKNIGEYKSSVPIKQQTSRFPKCYLHLIQNIGKWTSFVEGVVKYKCIGISL